jgi:hypothetical protein
MGTLTDTLRDLDHGVYRRVWNLIRQFWTGETWIRVTDDARNLKWVGLNATVANPLTGVPVVVHSVADLDVDIVIDDAPDTIAPAIEQFQALVELKKLDAQNEIPFRLLIEAAPNLRNRDRLLQMMERAAGA